MITNENRRAQGSEGLMNLVEKVIDQTRSLQCSLMACQVWVKSVKVSAVPSGGKYSWVIRRSGGCSVYLWGNHPHLTWDVTNTLTHDALQHNNAT